MDDLTNSRGRPNNLALVTGAGKRLGREFALFLAAKGYDLCIHYNSSATAAEDCAAAAREYAAQRQYKIRTMTKQANLAIAAEVAELLPAVQAELGTVSLLINCASVFSPEDFMHTSAAQFDRDLATNLKAPFFLIQDFARQPGLAAANAGSSAADYQVINLLDATHQQLPRNYFLYHLTKQALYQLTLMTARNLAPRIRVNGLAPGPALPAPGKDAAHLAKVAQHTPLGISSPPATLVAGLAYLLAARTVTGQILYIDSGTHLNHR